MAALIHVYNVVILPKIWIYALVCFVYPLTVWKVLNSMLKDYMSRSLCAGLNSGKKILSIFLAGFLAGIMPGILSFTAGIIKLHSIFLARILPEFLLI